VTSLLDVPRVSLPEPNKINGTGAGLEIYLWRWR
jgi:hypothetical protein